MVGVVPQTISRAKDEKLQALGVELLKIAGGGSDLLRHATALAEERGGYFVHPHLDPLWTDGYQGIAAETECCGAVGEEIHILRANDMYALERGFPFGLA